MKARRTTRPRQPALRWELCLVGCVILATSALAKAHTFANSAPIAIPMGAAPASPYPSAIAVSGLTTPVTSVRVELHGLSHTVPDDVDILLVGPTGVTVLLMSDAGGAAAITGVDLTFADGPAALPDDLEITPGTYSPSNYPGTEGPTDFFFGPAPSPSYGATLSVLSGTQANGTWNLYVQDDGSNSDAGTIAAGWSLTIIDPPLGTGFTYQGRMKQAGAPLNGMVDLRYTLLDGIGGTVGSPVQIDNVTVTAGLFTVELNSNGEFGLDAFDGEARLLEVAVANPAGSSFATLSPPQPVTGAPYATTAKSAFTLEAPGEGPQAVFVDDNGNVGIGTNTPSAKLEVSGGDIAVTGGGNGVAFPDGSKLTSAPAQPPIGAIFAWHKDLPNTPSLPDGWVECNGQLLSDPDSPYNGQTMPDLNSTPAGNEGGRFLRGSTHSGDTQTDEFRSHVHGPPGGATGFLVYEGPTSGSYFDAIVPNNRAEIVGVTGGTGGAETRPINMSVVWIMRVK